MEFLEGESLAERLETGPLPIAEVLQYGIQIASALDKAHRRGVTHRDLKPGNIMLTKSGAKLLDFGLARDPDKEEVEHYQLLSCQIGGLIRHPPSHLRNGKPVTVHTQITVNYALTL